MLSDAMIITKTDYPKIFEAFETISHDCGGGAGHHNYAVPEVYAPRLADYEVKLNALTDADFEDFCIGEHNDMLAISERDGYQPVSDFLTDFFDGWSRSNLPVALRSLGDADAPGT
jgi:hypothetical protein